MYILFDFNFQLAIIVVFVFVFAFYKANLHKSAHLHGETDRETLNISTFSRCILMHQYK